MARPDPEIQATSSHSYRRELSNNDACILNIKIWKITALDNALTTSFAFFFQDRAVFANQAKGLLSRMDKDASFFEELESRSLAKGHHEYIFEKNRGEIREMLLQFEVNEKV